MIHSGCYGRDVRPSAGFPVVTQRSANAVSGLIRGPYRHQDVGESRGSNLLARAVLIAGPAIFVGDEVGIPHGGGDEGIAEVRVSKRVVHRAVDALLAPRVVDYLGLSRECPTRGVGDDARQSQPLGYALDNG